MKLIRCSPVFILKIYRETMKFDYGKIKENVVKIIKSKQFIIIRPYLLGLIVLISGWFLFLSLILSISININQDNLVFRIDKGASLNSIARQLYERKIIKNQNSFIFAVRLKFKSKSLKAGKFYLDNITNYNQLINELSKSRDYGIKITIPEGTRALEIADLLSKKLKFTSKQFLTKIENKEFLQSLNVKGVSLEGYLFPDTYMFSEASTVEDVIIKIIDRFYEVVDDSILSEINASEMTLNQILTLASIVEGECMVDEERPIVASLYLNRLKKNMRLEADPTIQYIIDDGPRRILNKDLKIKSPYNTYRYRGLPPGPINNPGQLSILAVLRPADTDYLYMVANGDGSHTFTVSYQEFMKAKLKFQKIRRQVAREKKMENSN